MSDRQSERQNTSSSIHRGFLGLLLAILIVIGSGWARGLLQGEYLIGSVGAVMTLGSAVWLASILHDSIQTFEVD